MVVVSHESAVGRYLCCVRVGVLWSGGSRISNLSSRSVAPQKQADNALVLGWGGGGTTYASIEGRDERGADPSEMVPSKLHYCCSGEVLPG